MELTITERNFTLPAKVGNFEELRKELAGKLEFYNTLVVTEDGVRQAKADRADLNRIRKAIDQRRKDIKKAYFLPYQTIEDECKALTAMLDKPIAAIDKQLQAFDERALQEKRNDLEEYFRSVNTMEFVSPDDVISPKWRNKTEKTDNLKEQIKEKIFQLKTDFDYLKNMYSDSGLWTAIFRKFTETKSGEQTLAYAVELERTEKRLNGAVADGKISNAVTPVTHQTAVTDNSERSQTLSGVFRVTCTAVQLKNLRDFMKSNGISFEVVK